ncbi:hypothetical protein EDB47_11339 [Vibrio crassostreae]|nr:hypothetical protein EDB44_111118 [Vibrio crassostreae]TCT82487.1 hypothetical protein EDB43_11139 [Vibrio crassostreae]TCU02450.1 hypothetical protein EDB47_11339 [Vibrio crassostreae]TDW12684.1 hypothetical protein EDB45_10239 [Vibrio crassostreae]
MNKEQSSGCSFLFACLHLYDYVYEYVDKILLFNWIHCYS